MIDTEKTMEVSEKSLKKYFGPDWSNLPLLEKLNQVYRELDGLRRIIDLQVDQIGALSETVEKFGVEEIDSKVVSDAAKSIFRASDSLGFMADDPLPHIAAELKRRFEEKS